MKPLRDFFLVLFFIVIGSKMVFTNINIYIIPIIILSFFILIGNPLILMIIMGWLGYTKRTSFLTGLITAQISEFSLIMIAKGVEVGHISQDILSLVTFVGLITIAGSSYFISYNYKLYDYFSKYLNIFEKKGKKIDENRKVQTNKTYDAIIFGCQNLGSDLVDCLKKMNKTFLVVDYNPNVINQLVKHGIECRYGDAGDVELLDELNLNKTKMVISTTHDLETDLTLISKARHSNKNQIIICAAHTSEEATQLYKAGATYVVLPKIVGGQHMCSIIFRYGFDREKFLMEKTDQLEMLRRKSDFEI